jgi:UDP-2,3-diacylglucosamine pyrophosphatase LpxH
MTTGETIVISDLHISLRSDEAHVASFCRFVEGLERTSRDEKRPLTLVVAGDFFNFDLLDNGVSDPARTLRRILERFPGIASCLAGFLAGGNRVSMLGGNHDLELFNPLVSQIFTKAVRDRMPGGAGTRIGNLDLGSPEYIRLGGQVHIEHGNRFDGDNIFESDSFRRVKRGRPPLLPLGSCMERSLLSRIPQLDYSGFSVKTPWPLFTTILGRHGVFGGFNIIFRYFVTAFKLMFESLRRRTDREWSMGRRGMATLDSPFLTFRRLYLDRSLTFIFLVFWLSLSPVLVVQARGLWLTVFALLVVFFLSSFLEGNRYGKSIVQACRGGARDTMERTGVSTVVMGHTHVPESMMLGSGASRYLNSGSFLTPTERGMPYVRLFENGGRLHAELAYYNGEGSHR